jgi:hypothetical protein
MAASSLCDMLIVKNIFWDVTPCSLVKIHWPFGGCYCLLQSENLSGVGNRKYCDRDRRKWRHFVEDSFYAYSHEDLDLKCKPSTCRAL